MTVILLIFVMFGFIAYYPIWMRYLEEGEVVMWQHIVVSLFFILSAIAVIYLVYLS